MSKPEKVTMPETQRPTPEPVTILDIKALERRLQNPFGISSTPIHLREPGYVVHIVDRSLRANRFWEARDKGWVPVRWVELADPEQAGGFEQSPEGYVVRGERQKEILMKMPETWWTRIQAAKTAHNLRNVNNPNAQQRELVDAAAGALGSQAAEQMDRKLVGGVRDMHERIERTELE